MKPTFLNRSEPLMTAMILEKDKEKILYYMDRAIKNGADALGLQFCYLDKACHNEKDITDILSASNGLPTYVTYYRSHENQGKSEDEIGEGLVKLTRCGATLCDVVGDLYQCGAPDQMANDESAIKKQMELIDKIHENGAEVLMSAHVLKFTSAERVLEIALEQKRRGADVCKIVTGANDHTDEVENLRIVTLLKKELGIPFLYLSGGECRLLRRIGPMLGSCMWLCVDERNENSAPPQPDLSQIKAIKKSFNYFR
ncbi:MAG: type I 3-dehydroquinate dehydratase [Ruminococcaceae bacterium]|nr:type I 3-dehydroquinate dehydratase [Oscillospiraceae bacterium]